MKVEFTPMNLNLVIFFLCSVFSQEASIHCCDIYDFERFRGRYGNTSTKKDI